MTTYAIAHMRKVTLGPEIVTYLEAIDETLQPFHGRFVLHGPGNKHVLEGDWPGDIIMVAFPDRQSAKGWYESPAYQKILPLRTHNSESDVILVDAVGDDYKATDVLRYVQ